MSELHEIDGIIFGGEKYTVGASGEVPEGLIDPMDIEWVGREGYTVGELTGISPANIPVKLPDIDSGGNYITTMTNYNFGDTAKLLTGVILPSHLVEVSSSLFDGGQLEFVEFGDHLTSIGMYAFRNNQLTSVVLPDSVTSIEWNAFQNNQLTSVVIPDSVTSIGSYAFADNPLEEVSIYIGTTLGSDAFPSSTVITFRIPEGYIFGEGLTSIGGSAYRDRGLTGAITIADSVTSIGNYAFRENQITSLGLPDSLVNIERQAFESNQITSVVIPDSVTTIGLWAFRDNPLTEVSIGPSTTYESSSFPSGAVITVRD